MISVRRLLLQFVFFLSSLLSGDIYSDNIKLLNINKLHPPKKSQLSHIIFSFLCIPAGTVFAGAANAGSWTEEEVAKTYLELSGTNIVTKLIPPSTTNGKPIIGAGKITIDCKGVFEFKTFEAEGDGYSTQTIEIVNKEPIFIAIPVDADRKPTNLSLRLLTDDTEGPTADFNIGKVSDGGSFVSSTVSEPGKLYNIKDYLDFSEGGRYQ